MSTIVAALCLLWPRPVRPRLSIRTPTWQNPIGGTFVSLLAKKLKRAMERSNAPSGRPWNPHALSRATKDQSVGKAVSRPYIDNLADGSQSNPSIHAITAIAAALDIPTRYLLPDCAPDDLSFVIWSESVEAQYLLRLLQGLSADGLGQVTALAEECRQLENLPPVERPSLQSPPEPARRWFKRRIEDARLSPDEVAHQMARSLLGKSDEE